MTFKADLEKLEGSLKEYIKTQDELLKLEEEREKIRRRRKKLEDEIRWSEGVQKLDQFSKDGVLDGVLTHIPEDFIETIKRFKEALYYRDLDEVLEDIPDLLEYQGIYPSQIGTTSKPIRISIRRYPEYSLTFRIFLNWKSGENTLKKIYKTHNKDEDILIVGKGIVSGEVYVYTWDDHTLEAVYKRPSIGIVKVKRTNKGEPVEETMKRLNNYFTDYEKYLRDKEIQLQVLYLKEDKTVRALHLYKTFQMMNAYKVGMLIPVPELQMEKSEFFSGEPLSQLKLKYPKLYNLLVKVEDLARVKI